MKRKEDLFKRRFRRDLLNERQIHNMFERKRC